MEIYHARNQEDAARTAFGYLARELFHRSEKPTLLLLSGGSALSLLEYFDDSLFRSNLSISLVDERWSNNEMDLNATAYKKTKFSVHAQKFGIPFIPIATNAVSVEESALAYEQYLKQWRTVVKDAMVITVLGIGTDGHTAGIMPFPEDEKYFDETFMLSRKWIIGYNTAGHGNFPARVTCSPHFLMQEADYSVVYACGEDKKEALVRTFAKEGTFAETPARILHEMRSVFLFTDAGVLGT